LKQTLRHRLTEASVSTLAPAENGYRYYWDDKVIGFGLRVTANNVRSYVVRYRRYGRQYIKTIGRAGIIKLSRARALAKAALDQNAARNAAHTLELNTNADIITMKDLSGRHIGQVYDIVRPATLRLYRLLWRHIISVLGHRRVDSLVPADAVELRRALSGKRVTYNRCITLIVSAARACGLWKSDHPFRGVHRFPEKQKQRVLTKSQNAALFHAVSSIKSRGRPEGRYADMILLLMLTGMRRDEWRLARWDYVDWEYSILSLPQTKTGGQTIYLAEFAMQILRTRHRAAHQPKRGYIFPSPRDGRKPTCWSHRAWNTIRRSAGLNNLRVHDLRHTAGSYAHTTAGLSQRQVANFLGHKKMETSERYIHDEDKRGAANAAARAVAADWGEFDG